MDPVELPEHPATDVTTRARQTRAFDV